MQYCLPAGWRPSETVLVFDLDDTLYAEYDYAVSGIHAVCQHIAAAYPEYDATTLAASLRPQNGWLDALATQCGFNDTEKQSLLWQYRTHLPNITPWLSPERLQQLTAPFAGVALISDGRSLTQRLKLAALGLHHLFSPILISEAYGADKPNPLRFEIIMQQFPHCHYIYIGDNVKKDFLAPKQLGWFTIGIKPHARAIHHHTAADFPDTYQPHLWLNTLSDLAAALRPSESLHTPTH